MARTLPKIIRELENLEKEPEISKSAFTALRSHVQKLDTRSIPLFLSHVLQCQGLRSSSSAESIILLLETLAKVHGHDLLLHIDSIMAIIMKALLSSSGSTKLHQACSKPILAITRCGMMTSMPSTEKTRIISSLCKPLSDCLMATQENAASGAALCLKDLAGSNKWRFASIDLVNEVCGKVAGALEKKHMQTYNHLSLVKVLCEHNASITEAYAFSLIRSGLHILTTDVKEVDSQNRLSAIQMINLLMKSVDSRSISSEIGNIIGVLRQCQKDSMAFVGNAASEALRTARMRRKGARRLSLSNSLTGSSFDSSSTASEDHEDKIFSGLPSPELGPIDSSLDYCKLVDSPLSEWQCFKNSGNMVERILSSDHPSSKDIKSDDSLLSSVIHVEQSSYGEELAHSYPSSSHANDNAVERKDGILLEEQASVDQNYMNLVLDLQDSSYNTEVREIESITKPSGKQKIQDAHLAIDSLKLASSTSSVVEVHKEETKLLKSQVYIDEIYSDPIRALDVQVSSSTCDTEVADREGSKLPKFSVSIDGDSSDPIGTLDLQDLSFDFNGEKKNPDNILKLNDTDIATDDPKLISSTCAAETVDIEDSGSSKFHVFTDDFSLNGKISLSVQNSSFNFGVEEAEDSESAQKLNDQQKMQDSNITTDATKFVSVCHTKVIDGETRKFSKSQDFTKIVAFDVQDSFCNFDAEEKRSLESIQKLNDQLQIQDTTPTTDATKFISVCHTKVIDGEAGKLSKSQDFTEIVAFDVQDSLCKFDAEETRSSESIKNLNDRLQIQDTSLATDATKLKSLCDTRVIDEKDGKLSKSQGFTELVALDVQESFCKFDVKEIESIQKVNDRLQIHDSNLTTDPIKILSMCDTKDEEGGELSNLQDSKAVVTLDVQDSSYKFNFEETKSSESIQKLNDQLQIQGSNLATDSTELISPICNAKPTDREAIKLSKFLVFGNDFSSVQTDVLDREAKFQKRKKLKTLRIVNSDLASGATNVKVLKRKTSKSSESESTRPLDKENSSCNLIGRTKERKNTEHTQVHDSRQKVEKAVIHQLWREGSEPSASQVFIDECCSNQMDVSSMESSSGNLMAEVETTINSEITQELNKQQEYQNNRCSPSTIELLSCSNVAEVFPRKNSMVSNVEDTSGNLKFGFKEGRKSDDGVLSASGSNDSNDHKNLSETSLQVKEVHTYAKSKKKFKCGKQTLRYVCCVVVVLLALILIPQQLEVKELSEVVPT